MELEHVLATNREVAWANSCWKKKRGRDGKRGCAFTMMRKNIEKECEGPGSFARLQLEDLEVKWPRYDIIVSLDNRNMN